MNSAKKLVVLCITLAEPGGATSFVFGFARWLKHRGYDVHVIAGTGDWLYNQCNKEEIPIHRIKWLSRQIQPLRDLLAYQKIKQLLTQLKPDAFHGNSSKIGVMGCHAAKKCKISRIVYRIGGWAFLEPHIWPIPWLYQKAEALTARDKNKIVCLHPGDVKVAQELKIKPQEGFLLASNGIDIQIFDLSLQTREYARRALNLDTEAFIFGTIAHFYPAKDLPRYLEACAHIHKERSDVRFVIIGSGKEVYKIKKKINELELSNVVWLVGNRENAGTLLHAFDAFVLPSAKEGMPNALLEAMAARLPCVATDVGAVRWMLGENGGWIVPKQDPVSLTNAMLDLLTHPLEAKKRAEEARRQIETRFPLEQSYLNNERALFPD